MSDQSAIPRYQHTSYAWERGYAVETVSDGRVLVYRCPRTHIYRIPVRGPFPEVVWAWYYGESVTIGGLDEAHYWALAQVERGLLPRGDAARPLAPACLAHP